MTLGNPSNSIQFPLKTLYSPGTVLVLSRAIGFTMPYIPGEGIVLQPLSLFLIHPLSRPSRTSPRELDEINSFSFLICLGFYPARFYFSDDGRLLSPAVIFLSSYPRPLFFPVVSFFDSVLEGFLRSALMARQSSGVQKGNISWKLERIHPCCYGMN